MPSLSQMVRDGWFRKNKGKALDLPLNEGQLKQIREGKEVVVDNGRDVYIIYIRKNADKDCLTPDDLIIKQLPLASSLNAN